MRRLGVFATFARAADLRHPCPGYVRALAKSPKIDYLFSYSINEPDETAMRNPARVLPAVRKPGPDRLSAAGLRAFFNIARDWGLRTEEQLLLLGEPARSTFFKWKSDPGSADLKRDTLERLSYILGIYKALQILLPVPDAADAWVRKPNAARPFGGRSALERMLGGNVADLLAVRQYLDAQRGGWA